MPVKALQLNHGRDGWRHMRKGRDRFVADRLDRFRLPRRLPRETGNEVGVGLTGFGTPVAAKVDTSPINFYARLPAGGMARIGGNTMYESRHGAVTPAQRGKVTPQVASGKSPRTARGHT